MSAAISVSGVNADHEGVLFPQLQTECIGHGPGSRTVSSNWRSRDAKAMLSAELDQLYPSLREE